MTQRLKQLLSGLLAALLTYPLSTIAAAEAETQQTIYLLRHAEKQIGKDPELSPQGLCRTKFYRDFFSKLHIDRLYASHYRRNQQTATPIAKQQQLIIQAFNPQQQEKFAEKLKPLQGLSVVVAHNHLSEIIRALGGNFEGNIDHSEYRFIFRLELKNGILLHQEQFIGPTFSKDCRAGTQAKE